MNELTPNKIHPDYDKAMGDICDICKWTTEGLLNLGTTNGEQIWYCHGCIKQLRDNYMELIYAVGRKFPNETRYQTALRYITEAEYHAHYDSPVEKQVDD